MLTEKLKVYISCPISVELNKLHYTVRIIGGHYGQSVEYWVRGTKYNPSYLDKCDIFCLISPNNEFKDSINALPSGCRKELDIAIKSKKRLMLAYEAKEGLKLYDMTIGMQKGVEIYSGVPNQPNYLDLKIGKKSSLDKGADLSGKHFKLQVTPEQSKIVQEIVFEHGGKWSSGGKDYRKVSYENKFYLYIEDKELSYGITKDYFEKSTLTLISFKDFLNTYGKTYNPFKLDDDFYKNSVQLIPLSYGVDLASDDSKDLSVNIQVKKENNQNSSSINNQKLIENEIRRQAKTVTNGERIQGCVIQGSTIKTAIRVGHIVNSESGCRS